MTITVFTDAGLAAARKNAADDELCKALDECRLSAFFKEQDGLNTRLIENAGNLSGQKQRLALDRALI